MYFSALRIVRVANFFLSCVIACGVAPAMAQTVRVEVSAGKGIAFDPDKAMGTSMDILSAKEFETVY